jgi:hypothetical protein
LPEESSSENSYNVVTDTYAGFGLRLRSAFALPGTASRGSASLAPLELELESAAELDSAWSGPASPGVWRGKLGDGEDFTVRWGVAGDLLFGYGERARFRLDPERARLGCAPRDRAALDWQRVLLSRVLPNVSLAQGREALHASAVETPAGVVAIAAPSGMGKSTLAIAVAGRGGRLFADDTVVLERTGATIAAHPATPHATVPVAGPEAPAGSLGPVLAELGEERWIALDEACEEPRELAAVVLLERGAGQRLEAEPLAASPLVLAPYMLGLPDEQEQRAAERFSLYSDLVDAVPLLRLSGDLAGSPAAFAETLESALGLSLAAGGPA